VPYLRRTFRSALFKVGESSPQTERIELIDGEYADATLRASRSAGQPLPASPADISQSRVHDLNQLLILPNWKARPHN
jgi:hypothetical protein